jgi:hypothetical protein
LVFGLDLCASIKADWGMSRQNIVAHTRNQIVRLFILKKSDHRKNKSPLNIVEKYGGA